MPWASTASCARRACIFSMVYACLEMLLARASSSVRKGNLHMSNDEVNGMLRAALQHPLA